MSRVYGNAPAVGSGGRLTASYQHRTKEEAVREGYLGDQESGLSTALRDALKSLFSEPRLPDNPYYYLAANLIAYVDQSRPWKTPAADLLSAYDIEGGLDPLPGNLQLCKIFNFGHCCGLPHVLRVVSRDGASFLHQALLNGLPESLFHAGPLTSAVQGGKYTVQSMCSIQGASALWRPQLLEFPELEIRCDVLVRGDRLEEAVRQFMALVLREIRELNEIPVYFLGDVILMDGPAVPHDGDKETFRKSYSLESVLDPAADFEKTATRLVLGGKVLQFQAVLLVEGPSNPSNPASRKLRYEVARKTYFLHYYSELDARPTEDLPMSHYGSNPYDALYSGYFLDVNTARQYCNMYVDLDHEPYYRDNLSKQKSLLRARIEADLQHGHSLDAWRHLLLLVLLHDPTTVKTGRLVPEAFPTLEDLALKAPQMVGGDVGWLLSTIPNLLRINSSAANELQGIVRELEAISVAASKWPAKLAFLRAAAAVVNDNEEGGAANPQTGDSHRTVRTPEVSRAMAIWLTTFDLEGRLLQQLVGLRERILTASGIGIGMFSGISQMIQRLVSELPSETPASRPLTAGAAHTPTPAAALAAAQPKISMLSRLLHAAALTMAHGFVTRCADVRWALMFLGIPVAGSSDLATFSSIAAGGGAQGPAEHPVSGPPPASWVLDVHMIRGAQVRAGQLAERVSTEGVMLQYAVDCKLDELLATVWQEMTEPPLPRNPYPRLLDMLRSHAAKMELWHDDPEEALATYLVNELTLLHPPSFIYAAHAPPEAPARRAAAAAVAPAAAAAAAARRAFGASPRAAMYGGSAAAAVDGGDPYEADEFVGYGSYAAVTCVDVRALQALRETLGSVLTDRHWQQGAYQGEVVPALVGDVAVSNVLRLDRDVLAAGADGGGAGRRRAWEAAPHPSAPFEHPRFYGMEAEEHHLVGGPRRKEAAQAFAREVVSGLLQMHISSPHVVFSAAVVGGSRFTATQLWGRDTAGGAAAVDGGAGSTGGSAGGAFGSDGGGSGGGSAVPYAGLERLREELVEAALQVPEGRLLASIVMYVSPAREVLYVPLTRHLVFQYRKVRPVLRPAAPVTAVLPGPRRPTTAEQQAQLWPSAVYQRVFMSEFNAMTWHAWNSDRGDPAQPYHYRAMVAAIMEAAPKLEAEGRVLQLQRSLLQAAIAVQDHSAVYQLSRVFSSAAQELKCLQEVHLALVDLLSPDHQGVLRQKLDHERLRRLLLLYVQRVRFMLTNPRCNYFSGLTAALPGLLAELREEVLATFTLNARLLEVMEQLAVWTHCCEVSVAAAVHSGLGDVGELGEGLRPRRHGGPGAGGSGRGDELGGGLRFPSPAPSGIPATGTGRRTSGHVPVMPSDD